MTQAVQTARSVASYLPAKVRGVIYTVLGLALALEGIWDLLPEPYDGRVLATLGALGFTMALGNTGTGPVQAPAPALPPETPDGPYPT